ncbi:MAG: glycosyltransferase family 4 protein [Isosphaeraceae bacterium]
MGVGEPAANRPAAWRRADPGHARKPRVAFFSPLPPRRSGVADYALSLLRELRSEYEIDVYHDAGYVPDPGVSGEFLCRDHRTFSRYAPAVGYDAVVYQMGNSRYHAYLYPIMLAHPGVVTLHDVCLVGLHLDLGARSGAGLGVLRDELTRWYPESAARLQERLGGWSNGAAREEIERACVAEGWLLNRRLLASENLVVVHSPWSRDRLFEQDPGASERVELIPLGGVPRRLSDDERAAVRDRFDIPRDALVVASLGFVHPDKLGAEALDAFAGAARDVPSALFVFVGEEADGGVARGHAASLGLGDRVRFLGRRTLDEFADLASAADVGVNLRRPPTNGETSAALLQFLGSGVATVVTDVGTFSDFPDAVVRKVAWDEGGPGRLGDVLRGLMTDDPARKALGDAAREHVRLLHAWPVVAGQYVEVIERARAAARGGTSGPKNPANAPAVAAGPRPQELAR